MGKEFRDKARAKSTLHPKGARAECHLLVVNKVKNGRERADTTCTGASKAGVGC